MNTVRREAIEAFDRYRLDRFKRETILSDYSISDKQEPVFKGTALQEDDRLYLNEMTYHLDPVINRNSDYPVSENAVIAEFGGLFRPCSSKIAYYTLNCSNSYAYEFLHSLGFDHIVVSSELHEDQIDDLIRAYQERNGIKIYPIVFTKGDRILMHIVSDPFKEYMKVNKRYLLKESRNIYMIRKRSGVTELIEKDHTFMKEKDAFIPLHVKLNP